MTRDEAKTLGIARFFNGKPCPAGHICERYVCNQRCCECQRLSLIKNRSKYPLRTTELQKIHAKKAYAKNRERILDRQRSFRQANPDASRAWARKSYKKNKHKKIEYGKEYQKNNAEKCAKWARRYREKYPEKKNESRRRYQARKFNAFPSWADTVAIREFYLEASRLSKETGISHHVDHIYPLCGSTVCGLHVEFNLQVIPALDNLKKGSRVLP
jgi:hypothetical protein